jgi:VanZ family protein
MYFLLSFLLWITLKPMQKVDWRKSHIWWILLVIIWYAGSDEWLQVYIERGASIHDFIANILGAVTTFILLSIFSFWPALIMVTTITIFAFKNLTAADFTTMFPGLSLFVHILGYSSLALIWSRYIHISIVQNKKLIKLAPLFIAGPLIFLLITDFSAFILGKTIRIQDVIASILSVLTISLLYIYFLKQLIPDSNAKFKSDAEEQRKID